MATNFDQIIDGRPIATTANSGFALWGLTCFVETFVQSSTFVLRMNSSAKNPHNAKLQTVRCKRRTTDNSTKNQQRPRAKMPTLRKIKRGALPTHKPTQKHHI